MTLIIIGSIIGGLIGFAYDYYKARNEAKYIQEVINGIEQNGFVAFKARR